MSYTTLRPEPFFNRTQELAAFERAYNTRGSGGQLALLYGRRRLGKTFLLQRFCTTGSENSDNADTSKAHCYYLAEQTTQATQRLALAIQLLDALPDEGVTAEEISVSWNALFRFVAQAAARTRPVSSGRFVLILDEFGYLAEQSPELPSVLQAWWDREGNQTPLMLVLCGSQLSLMASLGAQSAPLFGRFNAGVQVLHPLRYDDVAAFYRNSPLYSREDILLMYGILGGTPRYHALVDTTRPLAEEVVELLLRPRAVLENEARFLLSSEQIRDPAPYNAVLGAIAGGETQFNTIQQKTGVDKNNLSFYLNTLQDLGWIRREVSIGDASERRALYQTADPFLAFWYRFVAPSASALQFSDPRTFYENRIAPHLAQYMGWHVFESICMQWLQRHAQERLGLTLNRLGRYWSRDGQTEIDIMAEQEGGDWVFGECKWSAGSPIGLSVYSKLQAKIAGLPEAKWRVAPTYLLFSLGGFTPELYTLATYPNERLHLISGEDLLPMPGKN